MTDPLFRGAVYAMHRMDNGRYCWGYKVLGPGDYVYAQDNTGNLPLMYDACARQVAALNELFDGRCDTGLRIIPPQWMNPGRTIRKA